MSAASCRAPDQPLTLHRKAPAPNKADDARWHVDQVAELLDLPLPELVFRAQQVHREHFDSGAIQLSTLLSVKTGGCAENCGYCSQSAHHDTDVKATKLMDVQAVLQAAAQARDHGSTRFCMGAAWRNP